MREKEQFIIVTVTLVIAQIETANHINIIELDCFREGFFHYDKGIFRYCLYFFRIFDFVEVELFFEFIKETCDGCSWSII